jgi:hypothetical protein
VAENLHTGPHQQQRIECTGSSSLVCASGLTTFQGDDWSVAHCPCRSRHCHNLYHIVQSPMGCTTFP